MVEHSHSECSTVLVKPFKFFLALRHFKFSVLNLWVTDTQPVSSNLAIGIYSNKIKYIGEGFICTMTFLTYMVDLVSVGLGLGHLLWRLYPGPYFFLS